MVNYMLRETRDKFIQRLEGIRRQRFKLIEELETAAGFGDLRENSEFDAAMEQQGQLNREAENIIKRLINVTLIDDLHVTGEAVSIGTIVTVQNHIEKRRYIILGCPEDNSPVVGIKVTFNSPVSRSLIGKKVGDVVHVGFNGNKREMEVTAIEKIFTAGNKITDSETKKVAKEIISDDGI